MYNTIFLFIQVSMYVILQRSGLASLQQVKQEPVSAKNLAFTYICPFSPYTN